MRLAITGAGGFVGRFVVAEALAAGHAVTALGRTPPSVAGLSFVSWSLDGTPPDLAPFDGLVHAALDHVPGRFRGGEGDDPTRFLRRNVDGSLALLDRAARIGLRAVFLSSRAVFDRYPAGTRLGEDLPTRPGSLYGEAKARVEAAVVDRAAVLRATGVYGPAPGRPHKWQALFDDFRAGRAIAPGRATEVHGRDVARAVLLLAETGATGAHHASDLLLDRLTLLEEVAALTGWTGNLPQPSDMPVSELDCSRMRALGWSPGGMQSLRETLRELVGQRPAG